LPAHCCQPAVAGGIIYADLWSELITHLALQALFAQISPVHEPLLQAFPFPSTGKGDTATAFSGLLVYLQFMWEVGHPPLSCAVLLPPLLSQAFLLLITGQCCCSCQPPCLFTAHMGSGCSLLSCGVFLPRHSHQLSRSWLLGVRPALPSGSPACLACLFTVPGRIPFPQSSVLSVPHPLSCMSYLFLLLISQFLFFPGGGQSVQGAMLLWPRLVCGITAVP
jgi:hypothetical protein